MIKKCVFAGVYGFVFVWIGFALSGNIWEPSRELLFAWILSNGFGAFCFISWYWLFEQIITIEDIKINKKD